MKYTDMHFGTETPSYIPYTDKYTSTATLPTVTTPEVTSSMTAGLGLISGVASAIGSITAGQVQSYGYKVQEKARKLQADQAISQAKLNNLRLTQKYNDTMASQAVLFASQGRSFSSGSIQNILREDFARLDWDRKYLELSGEYGKAGITADAIGYGAAAKASQTAGFNKGLMQIGETLDKYRQIGGKDKRQIK